MPAKIIVASYTENLKQTLSRTISGSNVEIRFSFNIVEAASYFSHTEPNVLIYDIDSGIKPSRYISNLLNKYKLLIILTGSDPKKAYDYYAYGVKDYIIKPDNFNSSDGKEFLTSITERIKMFFRQLSHQPTYPQNSPMSHHRTFHGVIHGHMINNTKMGYKNDFIIAIASSTGGTEALDKILRELPEDMPPILIVQHMPSLFTKQFAQRLNNYSHLTIKEAEDFEPVYPGNVYIAPGDFHMTLTKTRGQLTIKCSTGKKVNGVRPSADILFKSVAEVMSNKAIGVILTGMGADGARGLSIMHSSGSINIGQDEESCVVYGMPKAAYLLGCIDEQLPLSKIPNKIIQLVKQQQ